MRFMSIVTADADQTTVPTPALLEAMHRLAEREFKAGRMIENGGLTSLDQGTRVAINGGKVVVRDGPFAEAKEVIGGYAIFEVKTHEEAVALAVEFMQLHADHMPGWEGVCEVREFAGFAGQPTA